MKSRTAEQGLYMGPLTGDVAPAAYELIVRGMYDGVIVLSAQNQILELNTAARDLIGHPASEIIGQPVEQIWPEWPGQIEWSCDQAVREELVLNKGGEQRTYDLHILSLANESDHCANRVAVLRDATECKRAEEALRQLSQELEDQVSQRTAELAREVDERKESEARLLQRNRELLSLHSAAAATTASLDLQFVLETVGWEMANLLEIEVCVIYEWSKGTDTICVIAAYDSTEGQGKALIGQVCDLVDYPLRGRVLTERYAEQMTISQPDIDLAELARMQEAGIKTLLILPMVFQDRVVGLAEMQDSRVERTFTDHEVSLVQFLTTQAASAVENARLYDRAQREIMERIRAEEQIKASLEEKEVLLKEIHHRVKNNLQVISSMLNLQAQSIEDQSTLRVLQESQNRIRSMALIHERLYRSEDLARVDFGVYIRDLATHLVRSYRARSGPVNLRVDADGVFLDIDTAISCGLIVNELICNSLKYAFPDDSEGEIRVEIHLDQDDQLTMIVSDDGVGLPEGLDFRNTGSLGLQLVNALVGQLEGNVEFRNNRGTECRIVFATPRTGMENSDVMAQTEVPTMKE
jgi:PAS domain S-box-containing protein